MIYGKKIKLAGYLILAILMIGFISVAPAAANDKPVPLKSILSERGIEGLENFCLQLQLLGNTSELYTAKNFQDLGNQLVKEKNLPLAQRVFRLGQKMHPQSISMYYTLARIYRTNQQPEKELETFEKAAKLRNQRILKEYLLKNKSNIKQTAQQVIDKYLQAIGGKQQILKIISISLTLAPLNSIDSTPFIRRYYKYPSLIRQEILPQGPVRVTDGNQVWQKVDSGWEKQARHPMRYMPNIYKDFINYRDRGIVYKNAGLEAIDGDVFYHLIKIYPSGEKRHFYFSADTGLLMMARRIFGGSLDIKRICDYRRVAGILYPHLEVITSKVGMGGFHGSRVIDIQINNPLDNSLFGK